MLSILTGKAFLERLQDLNFRRQLESSAKATTDGFKFASNLAFVTDVTCLFTPREIIDQMTQATLMDSLLIIAKSRKFDLKTLVISQSSFISYKRIDVGHVSSP